MYQNRAQYFCYEYEKNILNRIYSQLQTKPSVTEQGFLNMYFLSHFHNGIFIIHIHKLNNLLFE